jgi:diaminopropionate ammonia-lyase
VTSVTAGYGLIASELQAQLASRAPTHLFVQAGVGGLAAALSEGLSKVMVAPAAIVVVEPASAACVAAGLAAAKPVQIAGNLNSCASMLSCGQASAAALEVLQHHRARCLSVDEATLSSAVDILQQHTSVSTTPSGAAGFAGFMTAARSSWWQRELQLTARSDVLLVVTERCQPDPVPV